MTIDELVNEIIKHPDQGVELRKQNGEMIAIINDLSAYKPSKNIVINYNGTVVDFYKEIISRIKEFGNEFEVFDETDSSSGYARICFVENGALIEFQFSELYGLAD